MRTIKGDDTVIIRKTKKYHKSLRWHGVSKNARERGGGGGGGRGTDEKDTEKSAKLVMDHVANKSVHYVSVGTFF